MNRGCIPVKALVRSAEISHLFRRAAEFGFSHAEATADFEAIFARKDRVVATLSHGEELLRKRGIDRLTGTARFVSPNRIEIDGSPVEADRFVISSGSVPSIPSIPGLRETGYWTSDEALTPERQPKSLVVMGGSAVGCELAQIYARLGTKVTIIEMMPYLLPNESQENCDILARAFEDEGIDLILGAEVTGCTVDMGGGVKTVHCQLEGKKLTPSADELLVAVGRKSNLEDLALEAAGVDFDGNGVKVDRHLRTSQPHIWASGDATGQPLLAHIATYEGRLAGSNSVSGPDEMRSANYRVVPRAVFVDPPLASVGYGEEAASEAGHDVVEGRYSFAETGRGVAMGETLGQVKLVADRNSRELLGAHIIGPWADALIHEAVVAIGSRLTVDDLKEPRAIHIHPTLSEAVTWAADEI